MLYNDRCQSTQTVILPDPDASTPWNDWLPGCGPDGFEPCTTADDCCHVYRGFNWTQSINTCRDYGGEIVTPSNQDENDALMNFISQVWSRRYNFNNEQWCHGGAASAGLISKRESVQKLNYVIHEPCNMSLFNMIKSVRNLK